MVGESGIQRESMKDFRDLKGFTRADQLGGGEPSTVAEYVAHGLTGAEPGKWAQNNGTIAMVTSRGEIRVWVPKADSSAPREVSFQEAIQNLKNAGYTEGNFYVPHSNG